MPLHLPTNLTTVLAVLHGVRVGVGGKEEERAIPEQKKKKKEDNIPGWREGQGLPATSIQQSQSRTCQAARAKYRGREEPGPGRGRSASRPYSAAAGDTFHHLLSEKQQSSQAQRLLPGNLDYVATETTTSRARAWQGEQRGRAGGFSRARPSQPGNTDSSGHDTRSKVGGKGQEGTRKEGD